MYETKKTTTISVKFPSEDAKRLKRDAEKKKVTTSSLIKKYVSDAYKKEEHEQLETSIAVKMGHLQEYFNLMEAELKNAFPDDTMPTELKVKMNRTKKEMNKLWQI